MYSRAFLEVYFSEGGVGDLGGRLGDLALADKVHAGHEPAGELEVVQPELLGVALAQPVLELLETVLLLLEDADVELPQLLVQLEVQVALEEQVHVLGGHLLEDVRELEEVEHLAGVQGVVLVLVVHLVRVLPRLLGVGQTLLEKELPGSLGEAAAAATLDEGLLAGPVGSVGNLFVFFFFVDIAIVNIIKEVSANDLIIGEGFPFLKLNKFSIENF